MTFDAVLADEWQELLKLQAAEDLIGWQAPRDA
jgi:hypothetical protein